MENYYAKCNAASWSAWEADKTESLQLINELQAKGHSHHCACRQVWGDGECECDLLGYNSYAWMEYNQTIDSGAKKQQRHLN